MVDDTYARLERATAALRAPFALVDLDALSANAAEMEKRAAGKPIRLASKSVRCRALQGRVLERKGFAGTLAFTLPEALWLAERGVSDLLVAYPTADLDALRTLTAATDGEPRPIEAITVMVDCIEQIELIERAADSAGAAHRAGAADGAGAPGGASSAVRVCLDLDAGWLAFGGRVRVGARRSPVRTPAQAVALVRTALASEAVQPVGLMVYEAQIAGVGDAPAERPLRGIAIRAMQARSARELARRRAAVVEAVQAELSAHGGRPLEFVNGGGTGSLERTSAETAVSELSGGSGLFAPTLFDAYRSFAPRPAALYALPVVRRPGRGVVTALGGGYLASGPADAQRLPQPYLPVGLRLDRSEGAGEVQTPLLGAAADELPIGGRVYMRHAKAGELCERFASLHLLQGDRIVDEVPTYRGEGRCFL